MPYAVFALLTLVLWIYCLVDVITCPESEVRNLPKIMWLLIVLFVPTIGSIIWLVAGRPEGARRAFSGPAAAAGYTEYDRPGRHIAQRPEDDEEFLRRCRERAEQQRREAKRQREADES
ncbi:PLD nuclease N-terminal domain-containing protein [Antrihabitans cavernicola]|uniref:Cardiolipin synthase N-terminal domain-containing protein n=1 Tax=Antrihabitans cavernicola TaxID=2495913 RepID=A0A5A7SBU6_9NOCA|nr:PLD nuclease N-terminal domain-containing protein [Spelaeibacter cavernicola]KAA0022622.1 hypothetical protein FOY51_13115 [Spelaeibacter cavernicola]